MWFCQHLCLLAPFHYCQFPFTSFVDFRCTFCRSPAPSHPCDIAAHPSCHSPTPPYSICLLFGCLSGRSLVPRDLHCSSLTPLSDLSNFLDLCCGPSDQPCLPICIPLPFVLFSGLTDLLVAIWLAIWQQRLMRVLCYVVVYLLSSVTAHLPMWFHVGVLAYITP